MWTDRPIWPQGMSRPPGEDPVPAESGLGPLRLGPAPVRPFKRGVYHDFVWRGWNDFGTGALGDMACHLVNMPFRALKLGYPDVVECETASAVFPETYPKTSRIRFDFSEREGLPPMKFWWYDGNPDPKLPPPCRPAPEVTREIAETYDKVPRSGCLIVGDKGKIFSPKDYGENSLLLLAGETSFSALENHEAARAVPQSIPRSPGHSQEWFATMHGGPAAYSNFDFASRLTEIILLGCVALRVGVGKPMQWDGPGMKSPNCPEAAGLVKRNNRHGWR